MLALVELAMVGGKPMDLGEWIEGPDHTQPRFASVMGGSYNFKCRPFLLWRIQACGLEVLARSSSRSEPATGRLPWKWLTRPPVIRGIALCLPLSVPLGREGRADAERR